MLIYKWNMISVSTYFAISNMYIKTKNKYFITYLLFIYKNPFINSGKTVSMIIFMIARWLSLTNLTFLVLIYITIWKIVHI